MNDPHPALFLKRRGGKPLKLLLPSGETARGRGYFSSTRLFWGML
jgi:hypothetical protein